MLTRLPSVVVLVLGLATVFAGGCTGKLRDERDSLMVQNSQLQNELNAAKADAAQARTQAAQYRAMLAARATAPATMPSTGLEGTPGVSEHLTAHGERAIALEGDVLFDLGKATIKPAFKQTLNKVAGVIKTEYPNSELRIEGHTDRLPIRRAGWEDNWDLGAARARAVALYLISQGIPKKNLYIASFADNQPRDPNNLAANRRVEIVVVK